MNLSEKGCGWVFNLLLGFLHLFLKHFIFKDAQNFKVSTSFKQNNLMYVFEIKVFHKTILPDVFTITFFTFCDQDLLFFSFSIHILLYFDL